MVTCFMSFPSAVKCPRVYKVLFDARIDLFSNKLHFLGDQEDVAVVVGMVHHQQNLMMLLGRLHLGKGTLHVGVAVGEDVGEDMAEAEHVVVDKVVPICELMRPLMSSQWLMGHR